MYRFILSFQFLLLLVPSAFAQVTIAPTNLFLDSNTRFGTYMVINGSNEVQEVSVDFLFAYNNADASGDRSIIQDDSSEIAQTYSIADRLRAFPQNFTLTPGQRQVIRLRISNTSDLGPGTYWSRIKTTSQKQAPPIELSSDEIVSAQIGIIIEQVTGLYFKNGDVSTGIEVEDISSSINEDEELEILTGFLRTGNSPFLGTVTVRLKNNAGTVVREAPVTTTYFFDGVHKQTFDIEDLPPGTYSIDVEFESRRDDVPASDIVQMPTVTESSTYTIR
ncbi:MAG: hypothetical protein BalsKO_08580 [Balneolaceae bacterium]